MNQNMRNIILICLGVLLVVVIILIISSVVKKSSTNSVTSTKYSCQEDKCVVTKGGKYSSKNCNNECVGKTPTPSPTPTPTPVPTPTPTPVPTPVAPGSNPYTINFPQDVDPDYGVDKCETGTDGIVDAGSDRWHCSIANGTCTKDTKKRCLPGGYVNPVCDFNCVPLYNYPENLGTFYTCKDNACVPYIGGAFTTSTCQNACASKYKLIVDANNLQTFKQHFVWDNPIGIKQGPDPTGGGVSYAYALMNYHLNDQGEQTSDPTWD